MNVDGGCAAASRVCLSARAGVRLVSGCGCRIDSHYLRTEMPPLPVPAVGASLRIDLASYSSAKKGDKAQQTEGINQREQMRGV